MLLLLIIRKLGLKPRHKLDGFNCKVWVTYRTSYAIWRSIRREVEQC